MAVIMLLASNRSVMQGLTIGGLIKVMGWLATLVMVVASIAFFIL